MTHNSKILAALPTYGEHIALEAGVQKISYAALCSEIEKTTDLVAGHRMVALMMKNSPAWIITDLACMSEAIPLLPLPEFFSDRQITHSLKDAGADVVFTDQPGRFSGKTEEIIIGGHKYYRIELDNKPVELPAGTAKITYTSGTTDAPKGVCLSLLAEETVASSLLDVIGSEASGRHVCLLPLGVLLENVAGVYTALLAGATICLPEIRREPAALHDVLAGCGASSCILVPELLRLLLADGRPLPELRYAAVGGARVAPELLEAAKARGIAVYQGYGLSEASSVVAVNTPSANRVGSVGRALPHAEIRINNDGEIMLRQPLFSGYLGTTAKSQEWYATGDIGRIDDDGFIYIEGRKKNIYITSFGRNISPEWLESLLTAHPAIEQAAVFGEAMPENTAIIVSRHPRAVAEAIRQVNEKLPDYARIGTHVLAHEPFSPRNGQLTGTGRPRREAILAAYANNISVAQAPLGLRASMALVGAEAPPCNKRLGVQPEDFQ